MERDLVFDVGMHRGEDTAYYLRKGYRVVAFEANPDLVAENNTRFAAEIDRKELTIVSGAITADASLPVVFYRHPTQTEWGTTDPTWVERNRGDVERMTVRPVDLPSVLAAEGVPWYMKIDVEGADKVCLEALTSQRERPAYLSIESEKKDWTALLEEFELLEELGFDRFAVVQQARIHKRPVTTRSLSGDLFTHHFEPGASGVFGDDLRSWQSRNDAVREYRKIFWRYRFFGDGALINRYPAGYRLREAFQGAIARPVPGWFDTHAARTSVGSAASR